MGILLQTLSHFTSNVFSRVKHALFYAKKGVYFYQKAPKIYAFITLWITKTLVDNYAFFTPKHMFVMKISHKNASKMSVLSKY